MNDSYYYLIYWKDFGYLQYYCHLDHPVDYNANLYFLQDYIHVEDDNSYNYSVNNIVVNITNKPTNSHIFGEKNIYKGESSFVIVANNLIVLLGSASLGAMGAETIK